MITLDKNNESLESEQKQANKEVDLTDSENSDYEAENKHDQQ